MAQFANVRQSHASGRRNRPKIPHRGEGKRFVVQADERLTAFVELESPARFERVRFAKRDLRSVLRQKARII
jgi:hypothetical protein